MTCDFYLSMAEMATCIHDDIAGDLGFLGTLYYVTRTWTGAEVGAEEFTDVEVELCRPSTSIFDGARWTVTQGGITVDQEVQFRLIPYTVTKVQLDLDGLALADNVEVFHKLVWRDDTYYFLPTTQPQYSPTGWRINMRRIEKAGEAGYEAPE